MTNEVYPLTLVSDRYNGCYSGGKWTAWNLHPEYVPTVISGDDSDCAAFWDNVVFDPFNGYAKKVGVGNTPEEAIENLKKKLEEMGNN